MSLVAAVLFAGVVWASCDIPSGYSYRQNVRVFDKKGEVAGVSPTKVYHADNACNAFWVCFAWTYSNQQGCYVSDSDKSGYKYMFWCNGEPFYFNM